MLRTHQVLFKSGAAPHNPARGQKQSQNPKSQQHPAVATTATSTPCTWPCPAVEVSGNKDIFWRNIWFLTEMKVFPQRWAMNSFPLNTELSSTSGSWDCCNAPHMENILLEASNYHAILLGIFFFFFFIVTLIKDNHEKKTMATNCWNCKGIYWDDYRLNEAGTEIHFPDLLTLCTVS